MEKCTCGLKAEQNGSRILSLDDMRKDAEKVRPYDHVWDMYYDEFEDENDRQAIYMHGGIL